MPIHRRSRVLALALATSLTIGMAVAAPATAIVGIALNVNDVQLNEGNAGTTTFTFTVSLSAPALAGGVTFDIATADGTAQDDNPVTEDNDYVAKSLTGQTIPEGSATYTFDVLVNGDDFAENAETFLVNVANVVGTAVGVVDPQGQGTIVNDDVTRIHDIQGPSSASPLAGATVITRGIVTGRFQAATELHGFFIQEPDSGADADPMTSEGIFVFCDTCPTAAVVGSHVAVEGLVSELDGLTAITATSAGAVTSLSTGNPLPGPAQVNPFPITEAIINEFWEKFESMRVSFTDTMTVTDLSGLDRLGQVTLVEGARPRQFTEASAPSVAGNAAAADALARRQIILDDADNTVTSYLAMPDGMQFVFHPRANGGFSVGTQGTDFFRAGDIVSGLTGILDWSDPGEGAATWRLRPDVIAPATFTVANPRPAAPPAVGGAITAASAPLGNYFTTIDTTAGSASGPCGPAGTADCLGADSVAELNRQRERASIVICGLNAAITALTGLENTTASATISDVLGAVNARCGDAQPYVSVNTGGTLGTAVTRVALIYRSGLVSPVGSALVDLDPIHTHPPTAQTFDIVDATNPAFGERLTVIANDLRARDCGGATGADADAGDGQGCFNSTRTAQASRLLTWINATVVPAAGDPDVLLLGTFNAFAMEDPIAALATGGYTDLPTALQGSTAYSDIVDGQLGHLNSALASSSFASEVTGVGEWHINADEAALFDPSDEVKDTGEDADEEKPDGSALVPPRVVFQPATPYRATDVDPILVGLFTVADLSVTKTDGVDPVSAGTSLAYTISVTNAGPDAATSVSLTDTLPAGTTFVSLSSPAGWSCTTPAVGGTGSISCTNPSLAVGSATFTLTVAVDAGLAGGTVLSNTATASSSTADPDSTDLDGTASTTVAGLSADLSVTKTDGVDPVTPGSNLAYTIIVTNAGPDPATSVSLTDTLPAGTTFVSLSSAAGWSCTTPAVGGTGSISCTNSSLAVGSATFTLTVAVDAGNADGTVLSNTVTASSSTADPDSTDLDGTATTTVAGPVIVAPPEIAKTFSPATIDLGGTTHLTFTITNPNGATPLSGVGVRDPLPAGLVVSTPNGLTGLCGGGAITATPGSTSISLVGATLAGGADCVFGVDVTGTTSGSKLNVSDRVTSTNGGTGDSARATLLVRAPDLAISKTRAGPFVRGGTGTYVITVRNVGAGSSSGTVTVLDALPPGVSDPTATAPGWTCRIVLRKLICRTSASLAPASSYPPITLNVRVGRTTLAIMNKALVSGGGDVTLRNNLAVNTLVTVPQ